MTKKRPVIDRLMERVRVEPDGCWVWTGRLSEKGYGKIRDGDNRDARTHRVAYVHHIGQIPDGLQIDHLCRNRACCNPEHLEAVTPRENVIRGVGITSLNAAKTHCLRGHALNGDNLRIRGGHWRVCLACRASEAPRAKAPK